MTTPFVYPLLLLGLLAAAGIRADSHVYAHAGSHWPDAQGWNNHLQVQNAGTGGAQLTITYRASCGQPVETTSDTLDRNAGKTYPIPFGTGSTVITSDQPLVAIVNSDINADGIVDMQTPVGPPAQAPVYLPGIRKNADGSASSIAIHNPGTTYADIFARGYDKTGQQTYYTGWRLQAGATQFLDANDLFTAHGLYGVALSGETPLVAALRNDQAAGADGTSQATATQQAHWPVAWRQVVDGQARQWTQFHIQNAGPTPALVQVSYMTPSG